MAWLRIDDRVRTHPKIVKAGPAAAWLWFCGVCYCREQLTDGFIQSAMVGTLAPGLTGTRRHVRALVDAGLWHVREGGYEVHDFLDWNPSRAEVEAAREQDRRRKRNGGSVLDSDEIPDGNRSDASRARAGDAGLGSVSGSLKSSGDREESARETRPMRRGFGAGAGAGMNPRDHLRHAWCGERICVPAALHADFQRRMGGDPAEADATLRALYQRRHDAIPNGPFGDDTFDFWRAAFAAEFPSAAPKPKSASAGARQPPVEPFEDVMAGHWATRCQELHGGTCPNPNAHYERVEREERERAS